MITRYNGKTYRWINPNDPDPIKLIEDLGSEIFRKDIMEDAIKVTERGFGMYFLKERSLDELADVVSERSEEQISREEAKGILQYLDEKEVSYGDNDSPEEGFLRFDRISQTDIFRVQDIPWSCFSS